jgi:AcrR family transcriptional regulator
VTTNFISEHLNISPGNLYYHFRNKEQIMDAIYRDMVGVVKQRSTRDTAELTASRFAQYYVDAMEVLWHYRAIFGDLEEFLRRGSVAAEHRDFVAWGNDWWLALFDSLAAAGVLGVQPPSRDVLKVVATNTILIVTGWWRYLKTSFPLSEITEESVRLGARHAFALIEPYLKPDYAANVRAAIASTLRDAPILEQRRAQT